MITDRLKILIIEDDELAANLMKEFLEECDFSVECVHTVTDGLSYVRQNHYHILLLDLNLPDFSGLEMLKNIKNRVALPIIVISAYNDTQTKVQAFKYGASDYMVKPVDLEELEARIWAIMGRHSSIQTQNEKNIFEIKNNRVFFKQTILDLTSLEFELLSLLIQNKNQTISRESLASTLSSISSHRSLDHHIKNIRKKIGDVGNNPLFLKTEYGIGYRLNF